MEGQKHIKWINLLCWLYNWFVFPRSSGMCSKTHVIHIMRELGQRLNYFQQLGVQPGLWRHLEHPFGLNLSHFFLSLSSFLAFIFMVPFFTLIALAFMASGTFMAFVAFMIFGTFFLDLALAASKYFANWNKEMETSWQRNPSPNTGEQQSGGP